MREIKVCFWLNVQSPHQSLFLKELNNNSYIDLKVCYFDKANVERISLGWKDNEDYEDYEQRVITLNDTLEELVDWQERIHIVLGYGFNFNRELIPLLIKNNTKWIHWSERYGITLAKRLNYNVFLFKLLRPFFLFLTKRKYGKLVQKYALGCFAQGTLAKKDFQLIGISKRRIKNLFYTSNIKFFNNDLKKMKETKSAGKITFLYIGQLSKRKGTEDLLQAFRNIASNNVELLLVGQDTSNGMYKLLVDKLEIRDQVIFKGIIPFNQIDKMYLASDVFVFPSRFDGWGAVLNEAASVGLPLIATDQTGSAYHVIQNGVNGYLCKASNVKDLTSKMQIYMDNRELIAEHSKESLNISEKFTASANVERFINALQGWNK